MNSDAIRRLWHRVQAIVARARMLLFDDSGPVQVAQVRLIGDEVKDKVPRLAEYGLVSTPPAGADAVLLFLSGERSSGVIIATNHQTFRMRNLASGEVAIHDDKGRFVYLSDAGIHVQGKDDPVTVETTSDVTATAGGNLTLKAGGVLKLQAPTVQIEATTLTMTATTASLTAQTTITGQTAVEGATSVTGAMTVVGVTSITGNTSIVGALTNNGVDVGDEHEHSAGSLHADGTPVTGTSGGVTP